MSASVTPLIAGNWKMNGLRASLNEIEELKARLSGQAVTARIAICPPATLLGAMSAAAEGSAILTGGQDCHTDQSGAHTGDISAQMLRDAGAYFVIVGHSERRADHGETDELVCAKAEAAIAVGIAPIICVGETENERLAGDALDVVASQIAASVPDAAATSETVIAYEPIWAIGTGRTPTNTDIAEMHAHMRSLLVNRFGEAGARIALLYGGSMKPGNAGEILAIDEVNGGLVGGASLKAADFHSIISAA